MKNLRLVTGSTSFPEGYQKYAPAAGRMILWRATWNELYLLLYRAIQDDNGDSNGR